MLNINEQLSQKAKERKDLLFSFRYKQRLTALVLWAGFCGGVWWYAVRNDLTFVEMVQTLADLFQGRFGVFIYVLVYLIRPLLFFSATVLTIAGGSIFGPVWGFVIVVLASNSSAMIAYVIGRFFGAEIFVENDQPATWWQPYISRLHQHSFETVLIMRLIFLPYDLVNYLCGFLRIDWKAYLLATALGSIPGTIAFVLFGASIDIGDGIVSPKINGWAILASVGIVFVSIVASRYLKSNIAKG